MHDTATVSILRTPWLTAWPMAVASAHIPDPNALFSTLAPSKVEPSAATTTAPTRNRENGA